MSPVLDLARVVVRLPAEVERLAAEIAREELVRAGQRLHHVISVESALPDPNAAYPRAGTVELVNAAA